MIEFFILHLEFLLSTSLLPRFPLQTTQLQLHCLCLPTWDVANAAAMTLICSIYGYSA